MHHCGSTLWTCLTLWRFLVLVISLHLVTRQTEVAGSSSSSSSSASSSSCLQSLNDGLRLSCTGSGDMSDDALFVLADTYYKCVSQPQATEEVRMLAPQGTLTKVFQRAAEEFRLGNNITVTVEPSSLGALAQDLAVASYYDAWVISTALLPYAINSKSIISIDSYTRADPGFDWKGLAAVYRNRVSVWEEQYYALPVDSDSLALYYRRDFFERQGLDPPMSWERLLAITALMNSTDFNEDGQPDYSLCWELKPGCDLDTTLGPLLAPMIQTQGTSQGFYLDPDNEKASSLVRQEVLIKALDMFKTLSAYMPPSSSSCAVGSEVFDRGECLMSISNFKQFAMLRHNTSYARGKVGVAHLPGWTEVLDRDSRKVIPCTRERCPYAVEDAAGPGWVNRAPMLGSWGHVAVISASSSSKARSHAYKFLANALQESQYPDVLMAAEGTVGTSRTKYLEQVDVWVQAGWVESDVQSYISTTQSIFKHGNIVVPPPIAVGEMGVRSTGLLQAFEKAVQDVTNGYMQEALSALQSPLEGILGGDPSVYLDEYRNVIGWKSSSKEGDDVNMMAVYLSTTFSVILVMMAVAAAMWQWRRRSHRDWWGRVLPPGPGEHTTLAVITLEVVAGTISPSCWSETIRLFKLLVRRQLKVCHGYESTNTAESLVLAFHSSSDALAFATSIQKELLELDWPQELMMLEECRPGYMGRKDEHVSPNHSLVPTKSMASLHRHAPRKSMDVLRLLVNKMVEEERERLPTTDESQEEEEEGEGGKEDEMEQIAAGEGRCMEVGHGGGQPRLPAGLRSAEETEVATEGLGTTSFCEILQEEWGEVNEGNEDSILYRRGPPVHIGIHSGLWEDDEVVYDKQTRRMHYTGPCVDCARRVCGACERGAFLLSETAFQGLSKEALGEDLVIFHAGDFRIRGESISLYAALERAHIGILALCNPVKALIQSTPGVLEAPLGQVTVVFMHVVGASTLLSWNAEVAQRALAMFRRDACELLGRMGGYMVEAVDGLLLASFPHPWSALIWCLKVHQAMLHLSWEEELLKHELCEEMTVTNMTDSDNGAEYQEALLFRGLRLKSGLALGVVMGDVNPMTGRMTYRGKVMNRAARISTAASTGQVWCSEGVWHACEDNEEVKAKGIIASSMGYQRLKGVDEKVEVFWCRSKTGTLRASRHNSACSDQSLGSGTPSPKANSPSKGNSRPMSKNNSIKPARPEAILLPLEVQDEDGELL